MINTIRNQDDDKIANKAMNEYSHADLPPSGSGHNKSRGQSRDAKKKIV